MAECGSASSTDQPDGHRESSDQDTADEVSGSDLSVVADQALSLRELAAVAVNVQLVDRALQGNNLLPGDQGVDDRAEGAHGDMDPDPGLKCSKCNTALDVSGGSSDGSPGECPECSGRSAPSGAANPAIGSPKKIPKTELCRECRKARIKDVCSHCNTQLCESCQNAHIAQVCAKLKDLKTETKVLLPKTFGIIEKCGEKLITAHYKVTAVLSDIERVSDQMATMIQQRCTQLKADVVREANAHNECRAEFQRDLSGHLVHLQSFLSDSPTPESVTSENIGRCQELCDRWMEEALSAENTTSAPQKYSIDFSADKEFLLDVCSTYGTLDINKSTCQDNSRPLSPQYIPINFYSKAKAQMLVGSKGAGAGKFAEPSFITVSPCNGNLIVTDRENNRIQIFQENGQFVTEFGCEGEALGQFRFERWIDSGGIAFNMSKNTIIVADTGNNRLQICGDRGRVTRVIGSKGSSPGQFESPRGVATDNQDLIYVCDTGNTRIQVLDHNGSFVRIFGTREVMGSWSPSGIAVHPNGDIIVTDSRGKLQVFSPNGQHKKTLAPQGPDFLGLRCPCGVAVDHYGNIIVTDYLAHIAHVFGEEGEFVCSFGNEEPECGLVGVAWTPSGKVIVVDQISHRLKVY